MSPSLLILSLGLLAAAQETAPPGGPCALPATLREALSSRLGSSRILTAADLYEDERALFRADHPGACPGVRAGKFFGATERPALAIIVMGAGHGKDVRLIVARPAMAAWVLVEVETLEQGSTAVVGRQGPGTYTDPRKGKALKSANDVVVLTAYESWQRAYIWNGRAFDVLQTSD